MEQATAEEKIPMENMKGEPKPYEFKKQENGFFKAFHRGTDTLLEGFELEEWKYPLEGGRYIATVLREAEAKAKAKAGTSTASGVSTSAPDEATGTKGFEIPLIGEEPEIVQVGACQYFELTVHEQDGDAKRKDIFVTDGVSRDFLVMFDAKVILPASCLNVLREAIYTEMECVDNVQQGSVLLIEKQVPRFSIQIIREVPQKEAEEWLRGTKRIWLKKQ